MALWKDSSISVPHVVTTLANLIIIFILPLAWLRVHVSAGINGMVQKTNFDLKKLVTKLKLCSHNGSWIINAMVPLLWQHLIYYGCETSFLSTTTTFAKLYTEVSVLWWYMVHDHDNDWLGISLFVLVKFYIPFNMPCGTTYMRSASKINEIMMS